MRITLLTVLLGLASASAPQDLTLLPPSLVAYEASDPNDTWTGQAPVTSLTLRFDENNLQDFDLVVTVEPARFDSGNWIRDRNAERVVFETRHYPVITFRGTRLEIDAANDQATLRVGEERTLVVVGTLDMHGIQRDVRVATQLHLDDTRLTAQGEFEVLLSDYQMRRPTFFGTAVDDLVTIRFEIHAGF